MNIHATDKEMCPTTPTPSNMSTERRLKRMSLRKGMGETLVEKVGEHKMRAPTTTVMMKRFAPRRAPRPKRGPELEKNPAREANTSGAPFPRARKVTPATFNGRRN